MRLIDADDLMYKLTELEITNPNFVMAEVKGLLVNAPTIEERKHGHWADSYECSVCGAWMATDCIGDCLPEEAQHYCYNCGAVMDEEI